MAQPTFATAINCIDGRVQLPVTMWLRERFVVEYVDLITYPGVDRLLAEQTEAANTWLRPQIELSLRRHASAVLAVSAHHDCLGNPVADELHREHLRRAVQLLVGWNLSIKVIALWLTEGRQVEVVHTRASPGPPG